MSRIAIVGAGISGLGAAFLLHPHHQITIYEKAEEVGGHTRTRTIRYHNAKYGNRDIAVDTGFIVFNHGNYPNLSALFQYLGVATHKSSMSFGVAEENGELEWSAENLNGIFGQRKNIFRLSFYRFLLDILRFNTSARNIVTRHPYMTMSQLIDQLHLTDWFARYYILPMGGAIWSCSLDAVLNFPAKTFVDFFQAHGLLTVTQQPQWYTVTGGSQEYLKRLTAPFVNRIRASCSADHVTRQNNNVQLRDSHNETNEYDQVVFACHADETLGVLGDPSDEEKKTLQPFQYQKNIAVLHKDISIMPRQKRCWASWTYHARQQQKKGAPISVTYWMNKLQSIDDNYPLFVTLNPLHSITDEHIFDRHEFSHPVYSTEMISAQQGFSALQGQRNTWFCGAHHRNGFHEDGLVSAINVAQQLGASVPWH